ncbi:hypothetical protein VI817_006961 [Penicillium citrinum]|nr:hypothetical protein VI817_006961 [Penicillium citrinum]
MAGSELGPRAILGSGLLKDLQAYFGRVHVCEISGKPPSEYTEDHDHDGMKRPRTVSKATKSTTSSIAIPSRADVFSRWVRPAVICVDAHVSINHPPRSESSGNIHGMPLAFATGLAKYQEKGIFDWIEQGLLIDMKKLVHIGTRDVDDEEGTLIQQNGNKFFDMDDIKRHGIDSVVSMALEYVGRQTAIYLSCDINALDPEWTPSAGHLVPRGLSLQEGELVVRRLRDTGNPVAMDFVEVNPTINVEGVERTID